MLAIRLFLHPSNLCSQEDQICSPIRKIIAYCRQHVFDTLSETYNLLSSLFLAVFISTLSCLFFVLCILLLFLIWSLLLLLFLLALVCFRLWSPPTPAVIFAAHLWSRVISPFVFSRGVFSAELIRQGPVGARLIPTTLFLIPAISINFLHSFPALPSSVLPASFPRDRLCLPGLPCCFHFFLPSPSLPLSRNCFSD